jgi:hypothetical protein
MVHPVTIYLTLMTAFIDWEEPVYEKASQIFVDLSAILYICMAKSPRLTEAYLKLKPGSTQETNVASFFANSIERHLTGINNKVKQISHV